MNQSEILKAKNAVKEQHVQNAMLKLDKEFPSWSDYGKRVGDKYAVLSKEDKEKKYPVKALFIYAAHEALGEKIPADLEQMGHDFSSNSSLRKFFKNLGYELMELPKNGQTEKKDIVETKQNNTAQKYTLLIGSNELSFEGERDPSFDPKNLGKGNKVKALNVYYQTESGEKIIRDREKGEKGISNRTLPYLACQICEDEFLALNDSDRSQFPVKGNSVEKASTRGLYTKKEDVSPPRVTYSCKDGNGVIAFSYDNRSPFPMIIFAQECLNRFNKKGHFVLEYEREGATDTALTASLKNETTSTGEEVGEEHIAHFDESIVKYGELVLKAKNVIFHGAPGTGKTYLAQRIAAYIASGKKKTYEDEDLNDSTVDDATKEKNKEISDRIGFVQFHPSYDYSDFIEGLRPEFNSSEDMIFKLKDGIFMKFVNMARKNCEDFHKSVLAIRDAGEHIPQEKTEPEDLNNFVFIIDEINRGEISKIFGELFFSIDPGYRGKEGAISTQYSNLHSDPSNKFYIPENVYIIGTMNDIDRSVDSFDFAMRRRFRFIELEANDENLTKGIWDKLGDKAQDTKERMKELNKAISESEALGKDYQIGASYFLKLKDHSPEELWDDYLEPLLKEYVRGMPKEQNLIKDFRKAYNLEENGTNEVPENS